MQYHTKVDKYNDSKTILKKYFGKRDHKNKPLGLCHMAAWVEINLGSIDNWIR